MSDITVNISQAPNIDKLHEEINALGFGAYVLIHALSYPGNITASYESTLSSADQTSVSNTITNHDPEQKTAEQDRQNQDTIDFDALRSLYDTSVLSESEKDQAIDVLIRCVLRLGRNEPI